MFLCARSCSLTRSACSACGSASHAFICRGPWGSKRQEGGGSARRRCKLEVLLKRQARCARAARCARRSLPTWMTGLMTRISAGPIPRHRPLTPSCLRMALRALDAVGFSFLPDSFVTPRVDWYACTVHTGFVTSVVTVPVGQLHLRAMENAAPYAAHRGSPCGEPRRLTHRQSDPRRCPRPSSAPSSCCRRGGGGGSWSASPRRTPAGQPTPTFLNFMSPLLGRP